jgi:choline dehydrogenase-like flavoprotein
MFINQIRQNYDFVIVGSGPAGISTALALAKNSKLKILIVESGSISFRQHARNLSRVKAVGDLNEHYYNLHSQRLFGGTSFVWNGWCTQFEKRSFLQNEWPIAYSEIEKYYQESARVLDLASEASQKVFTKIESSHLQYRPFYMSPPTRFGKKFFKLIKESHQIDVLLLHTCVDINLSGKKIDSLTLKSLNPVDLSVKKLKAKAFILAAGGVGNPKILRHAQIASKSPVGKYFMEHPHLFRPAELILDKSKIDPFLSQLDDSKVRHSIQLSDSFSIENKLLSFVVVFNTDSVDERLLLAKKRAVYVSQPEVRAEMRAEEDNKIFVNRSEKELDIFGNKLAGARFYFNYKKQMKKNWEYFSKELLRSGLGRTETIKENFDLLGGGHIMGTTRMGDSFKNSVVDKNCKVHEFDNLFIMGSSVFPSGAAANPTMTIVALSFRLGEHLKSIK